MSGNLARSGIYGATYRDESSNEQHSQLKTHYDEKYKIGWFLMKAAPRPCFTVQLLNEIGLYHHQVKSEMAISQDKYDYLVVGSDVPGIFNLGGDLNLFQSLIKQKNRDILLSYALQCIDILYQNMFHFNLDVTTVSLIQGDALGGGLEAALSSNLVIAERGVKLGLPEVLFNLFPGMGAYTLIARKAGASIAERMIMSGKLYDAEELYELGLVDILAEKGEGELELYKFIKGQNPAAKQQQTIRKVKEACNPISYQELLRISDIWVDNMLKTNNKDLRMMERLIARQSTSLSS